MRTISNLRALVAEQSGWAKTLLLAASGLLGWTGPDVVAWVESLTR